MKIITIALPLLLFLIIATATKQNFSRNTDSEKIILEYKRIFGKNHIPKALEKLIHFEQKHKDNYSWGFELCTDLDKEPDQGQYSLDEAYFERLMIFARADGSGSHYAFWQDQPENSLENAPVIFIGSEGEIKIIASNIRELLVLLSFGPEISGGTFYKDLKEYEDPKAANTFREWVKKELDIQLIKNINVENSKEIEEIISNAKKVYKKQFTEWMNSLNPQYSKFSDYKN
jgi:hypothetical protein